MHGIDIRTTDQFISTLERDQSIMDPIDVDLDGFEALGKDFSEIFDPYLQFIAASGEVNVEYPYLPATVNRLCSCIYHQHVSFLSRRCHGIQPC
jgi:hypothetical protein